MACHIPKPQYAWDGRPARSMIIEMLHFLQVLQRTRSAHCAKPLVGCEWPIFCSLTVRRCEDSTSGARNQPWHIAYYSIPVSFLVLVYKCVLSPQVMISPNQVVIVVPDICMFLSYMPLPAGQISMENHLRPILSDSGTAGGLEAIVSGCK